MEQPILTDAEVERLNQIRRTHECPVMHTDTDSPATLLGTLKIRHKQRGDLLGIVDKLMSSVAELKRGVTDSTVAWENAHRFAAMVDRLSDENAKLKHDNTTLSSILARGGSELEQENAALKGYNTVLAREVDKLKNDNGELRLRNQSLRADVEGMSRARDNVQADLSNALKELAQANGRNSDTRTIKHSDLSRCVVEIKPDRYRTEFNRDFGMLRLVAAEVMSLADLVKRYNQIAAAMADNSEG